MFNDIEKKIRGLETYIMERYPLTLAIENLFYSEEESYFELHISFELISSVVEKRVRFKITDFLQTDYEVLTEKLFL